MPPYFSNRCFHEFVGNVGKPGPPQGCPGDPAPEEHPGTAAEREPRQPSQPQDRPGNGTQEYPVFAEEGRQDVLVVLGLPEQEQDQVAAEPDDKGTEDSGEDLRHQTAEKPKNYRHG